MPELLPVKGNHYLWTYVPSLPAAATFTLLFAVATVWVIYRTLKTRTWFSIPFVVGGLFEVVGYVARIVARSHTNKKAPFIVQTILILVAPALFAASIYMTLGRLIRNVRGEKYSVIPVRWLTTIFVSGDVLSFLVQSAGGGFLANSNANPKIGQNFILVGLFIQVIMFGVFAIVAIILHVRLRRSSSLAPVPWGKTMVMLYLVSGAIMFRSLFRVTAYIMGTTGYLLRNEWPFYAFDAMPMTVTMVIYAFWYPSKSVVAEAKWNNEQINLAMPLNGTATDSGV